MSLNSKKSLSKKRLVNKRPTIKILSHKSIKTTIYIKSNTPYVSALKRITKFLSNLDRHSSKYVVVLGMGKAIEKTLSLGNHFEVEKSLKVEVFTKSIDVIDEVIDSGEENSELDEEDRETSLSKRTVSGVELRIYP